jgi:hypothetical protein
MNLRSLTLLGVTLMLGGCVACGPQGCGIVPPPIIGTVTVGGGYMGPVYANPYSQPRPDVQWYVVPQAWNGPTYWVGGGHAPPPYRQPPQPPPRHSPFIGGPMMVPYHGGRRH